MLILLLLALFLAQYHFALYSIHRCRNVLMVRGAKDIIVRKECAKIFGHAHSCTNEAIVTRRKGVSWLQNKQ